MLATIMGGLAFHAGLRCFLSLHRGSPATLEDFLGPLPLGAAEEDGGNTRGSRAAGSEGAEESSSSCPAGSGSLAGACPAAAGEWDPRLMLPWYTQAGTPQVRGPC